MNFELFDSHSHLDDEKFNNDREKIIEQIKKSGVTNFITAGYSLEGSKKAVKLAEKYQFIYATCGISPNDIPYTQNGDKLWKEIAEIKQIIEIHNNHEENEEKLKMTTKEKQEINKIENQSYNKQDIKTRKIVAIGEIGLDYYWEKDEKKRELQKKAFIKQIDLANELNLPIVIHTRDAIMDTLDILKQNEVNKKGVFHCCPQNRELIKEALKLGFYISFAGPITFKSSKNADELINLVPNERILIETDSPYLSPEPVRGTRNDPRNVKYVAEKIAKAKKMTIEEVAKITKDNAYKIFGITVQLPTNYNSEAIL